MVKQLYNILFILVVVLSCTKKPLDIELTDHTEQKIVGEGCFTDSLKKHRFLFTLSNDLGANDTIFVNEVNLIIKTPDEIVEFSRIDDGLFESNVAFKGISGEKYTIQFSYKGNVHEVQTEMPYPITIHDYGFPEIDTIDPFPVLRGLNINASSDISQYVHLSISLADPDQIIGTDTTWLDIPSPVYQVFKVPAGENTNISFNLSANQWVSIHPGYVLKVRKTIISNDVGEYLLRLQSYVTSELLNSQYYNPPFYFTNEAYGLGYGAIVDSTYYTY